MRFRRRPTVVIKIAARLLGDPEPGAWCPTCALPSALVFTLVTEVNDSPVEVSRMVACADCGRIVDAP